MSATSRTRPAVAAPTGETGGSSEPLPDHAVNQLIRWGGVSGVAGFAALLCSFVVVGSLGLPDASDVETLTDFADIESGRIAEHFLYLGALMFFALNLVVLYRLLRASHLAAALFGTVVASFGYAIMAAGSLLHVSTSPLSELYTAADATPEDLRAIEYAWHGAQSVFDTLLTTGVLLVPIGIVLFGVAMWQAPTVRRGLVFLTLGLGLVGTVGAVIAVVEPGSLFAAASVLAMAMFHLAIGVWMLRSGGKTATTRLVP
ncbi:MAG: DUF4386 domain-containing protein [Acidimicrobiia bacterium]|nr:DUF4386 domain-containing protein [Acidimicrobiia bacterium]